ncbi:CD225/dispanin family protein [Aquimarina pacifica]|uniref:CD225/dispanin family protein n=1 Tax=Aquimarina pacifica TaxID=1296415 RepID=UPI00047170F2|nr:CD225/dispanin family protein [Aquimarina pacifica]
METNQAKPKNYLVESILALLFCCLPLGIVALINATKVNSEYENGNYEAAQKASDDAKKWLKYTVIAGVVVFVLYAIFGFLMGGMAMLSGGGSY